MWIQEDKLSALLQTVHCHLPLSEVSNALRRYFFAAHDETDDRYPIARGLKVLLIGRILSDRLEYINVAKNHVDIADLYHLLQRVAFSPESQGKLGGKCAGLFLASQILEKLNAEFAKENLPRFTDTDLASIEESVDGTFGRPHIARYLVQKGIVSDSQEAFDKYLVKCDVAKYPLSLAEASRLTRNAGGRLVLAHPNDPNGTSLISLTRDLDGQAKIVEESMLDYIDGIECWHSRNDAQTTAHYIELAGKHGLIMTGGSDCHQKPLLMGTVDVPDYVAQQFTAKMCYN